MPFLFSMALKKKGKKLNIVIKATLPEITCLLNKRNCQAVCQFFLKSGLLICDIIFVKTAKLNEK
jgi:hypothetical protein